MNEKIEKYFKLLHPEYDGLEPGKQTELMDDRAFIAEHIDEIDKYYEGRMREGSLAQQNGLTEQEIIANALREVKINKYFEILHPEYDTLTPGEKYEVIDDIGFIEEHIDEIDKYYEGRMREGSLAQQNGLTEQEIIANALREVKINKYFEILHPEYDTLTPGEKYEVIDDIGFIEEHIDEIDKYYEGCMREGSVAQQDGLTEQEIIANALRIVKTDKYFEILHPEYDTLTLGEKCKVIDDRAFIANHIDEIDKYYEDSMREGSGAQQDGLTEQEIIANALRIVKTDKYFEILHPEYDTLTLGEKCKVIDDRAFIANHIDEIDKICKEHGIEHNGMTKQPILQEAIKRLREEIPVQRIGQATINTPTAAKKKAEQVENNENTRDNIKEGEEVGDDN